VPQCSFIYNSFVKREIRNRISLYRKHSTIMAKTKRKTKKIKQKRQPPFFIIGMTLLALTLVGLVITAYITHLDTEIRHKFDGKRWSIPAVVYARPLELFPGLAFTPEMLEKELQLAGYRKEAKVTAPGGYSRDGNTFDIVTRDFHYPSGLEKSSRLTLFFSDGRIQDLRDTESHRPVSLARIDPARIGSFHPQDNEDRIVLTRADLPKLLVKTLLAVEDKGFYSHFGISPIGILRALFANLRAGETVQGGSTLTQQLVKNLFLTRARTLSRKLNEAIMAILLERHYSKNDILTAYANEVFLGQDGNRAIHGFGLASQFYFRRNIKDLTPDQIAVLVGMVKGPSYFDPRRNPEHCLKRRKVVLDIMLSERLIDNREFDRAVSSPLIQSGPVLSGFNRFPAFLDLVRRQLRQDYKDEDLTSNGLKILTTLDPQVQWQVEKQLDEGIAALEKIHRQHNIQGAVVITNRENGEILAIAGGKEPLESGFNRALDAKRSMGSLIKAAVYLTALTNGYNLTSPVEDTAVSVPDDTGHHWRPHNFDRREHGPVPLYQALAHSYNLATVHLGLAVGLEKIIQTAKALGLPGNFKAYPSFLLGSASPSPLDVAQMYQTLASGGFYVPERAIDSVLSSDNKIVKRYGLSVKQRFPPEAVFLLNSALQCVVQEGTASGLSAYLPASYAVAGKTGTSDDLRDSWFAGFTGDKLAVVWLGRDDNKPTGMTGASGAMVIWGRIMRNLHPEPLDLIAPPGTRWAYQDGGRLPYFTGTPTLEQESEGQTLQRPGVRKSVRTLFQDIQNLFH
jgi:penicillin-binding protein 1B